MRITLLTVGKLSADWLRTGADDYSGRIRHYLPLAIEELKEDKTGGKKPDSRLIRQREGEALLQRIPPGAFVIALDEQGKGMTSEEVAAFLGHHMLDGTAEMVLIIGGAYGLSPAVRERAQRILSLSSMTLTHQMARLFLLEQLYRGLTILRNEPYHNR